MKENTTFADGLRQRLDGTGILDEMKGPELDEWIQNFYESGRHRNILFQLADHYGIEGSKLMDLLLARQLIYLYFMTNFSTPGTEENLQAILKHQNSNVAEICERLAGQISELNEAVHQTEMLREDAARVLAYFKKEMKDPTK
jgi:hypothetical protein